MKVIFNRSILEAALTPAMGCVSNKNTMTSVEGILIETDGDRCILSAYDLEKGLRITVPATVEVEGSYIINALKLNQIIRSMPENDVTIEVDRRNVAKISSGRSLFELHVLKGEDFPNLPELSVEDGISIKQGELRSLIVMTLFAVAQNDQRPALNGAFFQIENNTITAVSCDSNRLAVKRKRCEIERGDQDTIQKFIIPGKTLSELIKLIGDGDEIITLRPARKHVIIKIGEMFFFSRLIDEEYIDYERFIPKNNKIIVEINTDELKRCLERASLVTEDIKMGQVKSPLRCNFEDDLLQLSSVSASGSFNDEIIIKKEGGNIEIGFNCRYLLDAIRCCETEQIKLSMSTPLMSMLIEPVEINDDDYFIYLVLPVKMKD
ncbi:MAG: DNA polymerase III subunit beta [Eubacteriales bacterium]|nr:DNA polymerase III subunit beta [Eubacteriales bacterium]